MSGSRHDQRLGKQIAGGVMILWSVPFIAVFIWFSFATLTGLMPSRFHRYGAYPLLLTFFPLIVFVYANGSPFLASLLVVGGVSNLRYPLFYLSSKYLTMMGLIKPNET